MMREISIVDYVEQIELLTLRCGNISKRKDFNDKLSRLKLILNLYWQLDVSYPKIHG